MLPRSPNIDYIFVYMSPVPEYSAAPASCLKDEVKHENDCLLVMRANENDLCLSEKSDSDEVHEAGSVELNRRTV